MVAIQVVAGGVVAGVIAYWAVKAGARVALEQERERREFELEQERQQVALERREAAARAVRDGIRQLRCLLRPVEVDIKAYVRSEGDVRSVFRDRLPATRASLVAGWDEFKAAMHDHRQALWDTAVDEPLNEVSDCIMIAAPLMTVCLAAIEEHGDDRPLSRLADGLFEVDRTCRRIERSLDELVRGNDAPEVEDAIDRDRFVAIVHGEAEAEDWSLDEDESRDE